MPAKSKQEITESVEPASISEKTQIDNELMKDIIERLSNIEKNIESIQSSNGANAATPSKSEDFIKEPIASTVKSVQDTNPSKTSESSSQCDNIPNQTYPMSHSNSDTPIPAHAAFVPYQVYHVNSLGGLTSSALSGYDNVLSRDSTSVWETLNTCLIVFIAIIWIRQLFAKMIST